MRLMQHLFTASLLAVFLGGLVVLVPMPVEKALAQTADPVFVGAGDISGCSGTSDEATAQLLDSIAGTVFTLGDVAYPDGTLAQFTDCYGPTWGRHKDRTRPVPGNHDYHTIGAAGYYTYFGTAASPLDTNCTSDCKGYYSYDLGDWHIIALNSEIDHATGSVQEQWLRADLAVNQRMCTLAYWHKPLFSSGANHGNNSSFQPFWQALYDYGADVVLNGHDHEYERFAPQSPTGQSAPARGIREFVVGTGGRSLYTFSTPQPNSEVRNNTTFGVLKLTLHATSYDWQFVPIAGQTFTDTGTGNCVSVGSTPTPGPSATHTSTPTPGPSATPTMTASPTPVTTGSTMVTSQVISSADDAEQNASSGSVNLTSSDLELGADAGTLQYVGMRFTNVSIPRGATILNAYVEFEVDETGSDPTSVLIQAEAADNASAFTSSTNNISSRARTAAQLAWNNIPAWTVLNAKWQTPDISSMIQEVVNRSAWASGNAIAIIINGTGRRTAESYDGEISAAPKLVIVYATGATPTSTLSPTATPNQTATPTGTSTATHTPGPSSTPTVTASHTATAAPPSPTPSSSVAQFYFSLASDSSALGSVTSVADEDILSFNGATGQFAMIFDGSDVGVTGDVDAFKFIDNNTILISLDASASLSNLGSVDDFDIVQFDATSLGSTTTGSFSRYFDGSDVSLGTADEDIDALDVLPDGRLIISTRGSIAVSGASGSDEDLLAFTPARLGSNTAGSWAMYFDGSDIGLGDSGEDIDAFELDSNGNINLSTLGDFAVPGVSGANEDIFTCTSTALGSVTACNFSPVLYFDGSGWGLSSNDIDAIGSLVAGFIPTSTPSQTPLPTNTATNTATPTPTMTPTATATATVGPSPTSTNTPTNTLTATATYTTTQTPTPTNTSTATSTGTATSTSAPPSDVIFANSFESGNFSGWTASTTNGGNLSVTGSAKLVGNFGMQGTFTNATVMFVTDDSPNAEPRYRARFYFDPNSISMASGDYQYILQGHANAASTIVLRIQFKNTNGAYQLRVKSISDTNVEQSTPYVTITDAPHFIEVDWAAATAPGANNGHLIFWIDGVQQGNITGIDNDTYRMERVRLGAVYISASATTGVCYLDAFESRRQTYIGP